jgi:Ca-activated chloride channel family protein
MRALRTCAIAAFAAALVALAGCSDHGTALNEGSATRQDAAQKPGPKQAIPQQGKGTPQDADDSARQQQPGAELDKSADPPETKAESTPLSTFGIDIDTASYDFARRTIKDGRLPAGDTIRPEEFANAFRQQYPQPAGDGFSVTADGSRMPAWGGEDASESVRLLRIGLQTRDETAVARPDAALTFVIDRSGSMNEPGRLDLVQNSLHTLVDQLRQTDSVAIVGYNDEAGVVQRMTRASERSKLHKAIDALSADGSTNLEAGLTTGYAVARAGFREGATNRVILLSDGLANTGNTEADPILAQVREQAGKGIALLCVGVGSEYGDALMERLADKGDGFAVYVSERRQAEKLFVSRLPATLTVRALDAKVQVSFDEQAVETYRLVGYDNRMLAADDFRNDRVDGGEVGPGHSVTALYVVRLRSGVNFESDPQIAEARVRWLDPKTRKATETAATVTAGQLGGAYSAADEHARVAYTGVQALRLS